MFAPENWIIADNNNPNKPCELFIDVIENSIVNVRRKPIKSSANSESLLRRISVLQKRITILMSASVIERFDHFVDTYPDIAQRVPQRMIASYLGITPEALSKAKGDRIKKTGNYLELLLTIIKKF